MHLRFDEPTANAGIEMRVGCWEVGGKCGRGEGVGKLTDSVVFDSWAGATKKLRGRQNVGWG